MIRYLETFFRNKWLITIPALLLLSAGASLMLLQPKKYEAGATIWAETQPYLEVPGDRRTWITPAQIQSGRFTELLDTYTFVRAVVDRTQAAQTMTERQKDALVDKLQKGMIVFATGEHLVRVNYSDTNPQLAVDVMKIAIEEYNRITSDTANAQAVQAINFYKERIKLYEEQILPQSKQAITDYLDSHPEIRRGELDGSATDPNLVLLQEKFAADREQHDQLISKLEDVQTRGDAVKTSQEAAFRTMDSPALAEGTGGFSKKVLLLYGAIGAALSGAYVALFLALATELDRTMRNPGDIRRKLQLPVLEVVPDYTPLRTPSRSRQAKTKSTQVASRTAQSTS